MQLREASTPSMMTDSVYAPDRSLRTPTSASEDFDTDFDFDLEVDDDEDAEDDDDIDDDDDEDEEDDDDEEEDDLFGGDEDD